MSESSEEITEPAPECPKCEQPMVRRTARRGANAGRGFWGCSEFPRCRGIVSDQPAASTSDEGDASVEESRAGDDADEATSSDVAGKAEGLLTKVVKAVDKGRRWYLESDEPDASGRWDPDHRPKVLAYVYNRDDGRCGLCAGEMKLQAAHLEHIVPKVFAVFDIRKGGKAEPGTYYKSRLHKIDNLQAAHTYCNKRKGNAPDVDKWRHPAMPPLTVADAEDGQPLVLPRKRSVRPAR